MKLRIKETGEVLEDVKIIDTTLHKIVIQYLDDGILRECTIKNISDIEEVKDYEEPKKKYWFISWYGEIDDETDDGFEVDKKCKQIGNYFETLEEAEQAVEKLKAWKRLKDTYFVSFDLDFVKNTISFTYRIDGTLHSAVNEERIVFEDMKTIFGGEE